MATYATQEILLDLFEGTPGHLLTTHTANYGGPWTNSGANAAKLDGAGGAYQPATIPLLSVPIPTAQTPAAPGPDQHVEAVIHVITTPGGTAYAGICARMTDPTAMYALWVQQENPVITLTVGGDNLIATWDYPGAIPPAPGDRVALALDVTGDQLVVTIDGVPQHPITDSNVTTAGACGIISGNDTTPQTATTGMHIEQFLASAVPA